MKKLILLTVFWQVLNTSAYTATGNPTASGIMPMVGHCAADKINGITVPFGTRITLPSGQTLIVTDRFGDGRNNAVDIYMNGEDECWKFGRQWLRCKVEIQ